MRLFFTRLSVLLAIAFAPLLLINYVLSARIKTADFAKPLWTMNKTGEHYDYIVAGSSRAENIINVALINDSSHLKGINIAHSGSAFHENYLTLAEFLAKNNTKVVLLSADFFGLIEQGKAYSKPFHEYYFIPYLDNKVVYDGVCSEVGSLKTFLWKTFPLIGYLEYNNIYSLNQVFPRKTGNPTLKKNLGYEPVPKHQKINFAANACNNTQYITNRLSQNNLLNIIGLCKKRKVQLIFYSAPIYDPCYKHMVGGAQGQHWIDSIARSNAIPFFDLISCKLSKDTNFFKDNTHVNQLGADKFSLMIADSLKLKFLNNL